MPSTSALTSTTPAIGEARKPGGGAQGIVGNDLLAQIRAGADNQPARPVTRNGNTRLRARRGGRIARARAHAFGQPQFHCGNPPPGRSQYQQSIG